MKTITNIILFFSLTSSTLLGQVITDNNDLITKQLTGTWYVINHWPATKDTLVFGRQTKAPNNYGNSIVIYESGEFRDIYTAPCGNDERLHDTKGKWYLDKQGAFITTTIPIYLDRSHNKILKLTADTLTLLQVE